MLDFKLVSQKQIELTIHRLFEDRSDFEALSPRAQDLVRSHVFEKIVDGIRAQGGLALALNHFRLSVGMAECVESTFSNLPRELGGKSSFQKARVKIGLLVEDYRAWRFLRKLHRELKDGIILVEAPPEESSGGSDI